jgi:hypothetical protein
MSSTVTLNDRGVIQKLNCGLPINRRAQVRVRKRKTKVCDRTSGDAFMPAGRELTMWP